MVRGLAGRGQRGDSGLAPDSGGSIQVPKSRVSGAEKYRLEEAIASAKLFMKSGVDNFNL
jgi:hypothetical protein